VTCPCALSLATPAVLAVSVGALARRGVVATRGHAIEALARVTHVVLDKTGTLTQGILSLDQVTPLAFATRHEALALAAALEAGSEHPIARAVLDAASREDVRPGTALQLTSRAGAGVEGWIDGEPFRLGNRAFVGAIAGPCPECEVSGAGSPVWLGGHGRWIAQFAFGDALRPEAGEVIGALRREGKKVIVLSGDDPATVARTARELGIEQYEGGLSPEDKQRRVRALQEQGSVVAMVGDGVNDAPVLAQAQVSIAMGSGAVLSQAQSDLVLMPGRLAGLLDALRISRRTLRIVRQNLAWAAAYNIVALPLAVSGHVTPWLAGIGMAGSSLFVVLNALRAADRTSRRALPEQRREAREDRREAGAMRSASQEAERDGRQQGREAPLDAAALHSSVGLAPRG
jgi:P-type Cu2+ transporter